LVPTTQGANDLASVAEWMRFLRREQASAAFLLNATNRQTRSFNAARRALLKVGLLCPIDVRRLEDIQNTTGIGCGICEVRDDKGAEDLEGLWHHVRHTLEL
jgi:chromosome partitioning protein